MEVSTAGRNVYISHRLSLKVFGICLKSGVGFEGFLHECSTESLVLGSSQFLLIGFDFFIDGF